MQPVGLIGILDRLRRRWWIIAACIAATLAIAGIYLAIVTPSYTVTAIIMADRTRPVAPSDLPPDEFLTQQRSLILSPAVSKDADLLVRTNKGEGIITVSLDSPRPQPAAIALAEIVERYLKASKQSQSGVVESLTTLSAERDRLAADRSAKEKSLAQFKQQAKISGTSTDNVTATRRDQLAQALTAAQADLTTAKAAADAAKSLPTDPQQLAALMEAAKSKGVFTALDQERAQIDEQIKQAEAQLETQRRTLLAQHPLVLQTQRKIGQLSARQAELQEQYPDAYHKFYDKQLAAAQEKVMQLQVLLAEQTRLTQQTDANTAKLAQFEKELKQADATLTEADRKIRDAAASADSGVQMKLIQPPTAPERPSSPRRDRVLLLAALLGLAAGLTLAIAAGPSR